MPTERRGRLEALPDWVWKALDGKWEAGFSNLKEFTDRQGHSRVPNNYLASDGFRLGQWVGVQRASKIDLPAEQKELLEAVSGWVWDVLADQWEIGFHHLKEFADREGHAKIHADYKMADGYRIGKWVSVQRAKKDSMSPERRAQLEALPGWSWDVLSDKWEEGYRHLKEFVEQEGHAKIPQRYKAADGYRLGLWVSSQRQEKDDMPPERKIQLEALLEWVWQGK